MNIEKLINQFEEIDTTLPALFIGHGSPMNGIEIKPGRASGQKYLLQKLSYVSLLTG